MRHNRPTQLVLTGLTALTLVGCPSPYPPTYVVAEGGEALKALAFGVGSARDQQVGPIGVDAAHEVRVLSFSGMARAYRLWRLSAETNPKAVTEAAVVDLDLGGVAIARMSDGSLVMTHRNHQVHRWDAQGRHTLIAGGLAGQADGVGIEARFQGLGAIAVAPDGTIYVADQDNKAVRRISPEGRVTTVAFGEAIEDVVVENLAVGPTGALYVTDRHSRVLRVADGVAKVLAAPGTAAGAYELKAPGPLCVDADDTVYLVDEATAIVRIGPDGQPALVVDGGPKPVAKGPHEPGLYGALGAIALAPDGRLVAADTTHNVLIKVGKDGTVSPFAGHVVGEVGLGRTVTDLDGLMGMAVAPDGAVAVLTRRHGTEQALKSVAPDGTVTDRPTPFGDDEPDMAVAADGTAYVSDPATHGVWRVAPDGAVHPHAGPGVLAHPAALTRPTAVALDHDGRLLIWDAEQVFRVEAEGPAAVVATGVKPAVDLAVLADGSLLAVLRPEKTYDPNTVARLVLGQAPEAWAPAAALKFPTALAAAADGTVYATDGESLVRRFHADGQADVMLALSTEGPASLEGKGYGVLMSPPLPPPHARFGSLALGAAGRLHVSDIGLNRVIQVEGR